MVCLSSSSLRNFKLWINCRQKNCGKFLKNLYLALKRTVDVCNVETLHPHLRNTRFFEIKKWGSLNFQICTKRRRGGDPVKMLGGERLFIHFYRHMQKKSEIWVPISWRVSNKRGGGGVRH